VRWLEREPPPHWVDTEPDSSVRLRASARVISWLPLESQL
jgi:putative cardiolipin synthase